MATASASGGSIEGGTVNIPPSVEHVEELALRVDQSGQGVLFYPPALNTEVVLLGLVPAVEDVSDALEGDRVLSVRHNVVGVAVAVGLLVGGGDEDKDG